MVQEIRRDGSTTYVYSDTDSYVPLARIDTPDRAREYTRIYWYHTRPDGTPEQLSDSNGEEVWRIVNDAWGRVDTAWGEINSAAVREDNLRMQGQYLDRETGLHYNLFRYYDADSMHFISPDPIGLNGGLNLYEYAPNPLNWIDPLGLSKCGSFTKNPDDIHFMQSSIKNQTGEHTVLNNAATLKNGTLKPTDLPAIKIWQDSSGKLWTLDHRRLAAFKLSGLKEIPVQWATEKEIAGQMWKMTTKTDGKSIILKMGDGIKRVIGG